ncbi:SRPBCC family protein [Rhodococcus tukisamuensis]|uniref:Activator of Hsp90 ATPase homolog 1-like protein n=1 Tax=Rhodococcus tukisamuensis TaxID=168276 RepID=A0A1G6PDX3_9NOCA|nr:SRPBCC domain-containing protein [Rhodococcus tukisamuensis]SDC78218.1 hypothetical protein SAMN05444580_101873 [Rhodococcus tukisamuensis]
MTTAPQPVIEATVAAAPDLVWQALRDPALIRRWHGWEYDGEDGLDEEITQIYFDGVSEDAPARTLTLQGGDRFTLSPCDGTTTVRITRAPKGGNPEWDDWYEDITEGWATFLQQLRFGLERHGLAERRTLHLDGPTGGVTAAHLLGVDTVVGDPGSGFSAPVATGDTLSGTVWFRSPTQLGLTVDAWGPGLLMLGVLPGNPQRPGGGAQVIVSTYGQGAEEFAALADRWGSWWDTRESAGSCDCG